MMQEAQAATAVADAGQLVTSQLAGAALFAYLLQWVKQSDWFPWISEHTKGINYAVTGLMSLVAAVGIHYQFDATAGVLTIGGLHVGTILHGLWEWMKQWAFQQGAADLIFSKTVAKDVARGDVPKPTGTGTGNGNGKNVVAVLLAVTLGVGAVGCASVGTVLYEADRGLYASLSTADDIVTRACEAKLRTAADCAAFDVVLADSYAAYQRFNEPAREGSIAGVPAMVTALASLRDQVQRLAPQAQAIIADLQRWYDVLKNLLPKKETR